MFDLADLDIVAKGDEPQPLDLISPVTNSVIADGDGNPARVYVLSIYSDTMKKIGHEHANRTAKQSKAPTAEDLEDRSLTLSAHLLMARPWEGFCVPGQKEVPLPFTLANAKRILSQPWARRQVETFAAQEGNFLSSASERSSSTPPTSSSSRGTSDAPAAPSANG